MARVFSGERTLLSPALAPVERAWYRLCRVDPQREMSWAGYLTATLAFSLVGLVYLYVLLRTQKWLPLNPQGFDNMAPDLAWNTAVSFTTNTNWQFYSGESSLSYLSQMAGLAWHNFVSAAIGIAIAIAVIRGVTRTDRSTVGNFWVDMTRSLLYVLLPICVVGGLALCWQGIPQNFHAYHDVVSIEGFKQSITGGPMASQEVIKELGTNGGGFVNANSASPNENPTPFSNLLEMVLIFAIGAALTYTYGRFARDQRQGWALFAAMSLLFVGGFVAAYARRPSATRSFTRSASPVRTWRARSAASASPPRRYSLPSRPIRRAARSTPCTTRSRRWAASCRWRTCNSARSSSAASAPACTA